MKLIINIILLFSLIGCGSKSYLSPRPDTSKQFSVIQGTTTKNSTILSVVSPKNLKVSYEVKDKANKTISNKVKNTFKRAFSPFKVEHIEVKNLELNNLYTLKISSDNKRWQDERTFSAFNHESDSQKVLVASCMIDTYNEIGNQIWPKAFKHKPDLLFLIGDNIYADVFSGVYLGGIAEVTPKHLWNRYIDHAIKLKLYRMKHLTPTYVTWDDHDYGVNNGGIDYKYKSESKKLLNIFFPRKKTTNYAFGPGVSSKLHVNGTNFIFLDSRTFRQKKGKNNKHLGKKQKKWVFKNMDDKHLNWLIKGDQFFGAYHPFESFEGDHPVAFKDFISDLKQSKKKVVFLSGDRHLLEVMKFPADLLGYETLEYTVSGIQTKMYPGSLKRDPNKYRTGGFDGIANYGIIKTKKKDAGIEIIFEGHSLDRLVYKTEDFIAL